MSQSARRAGLSGPARAAGGATGQRRLFLDSRQPTAARTWGGRQVWGRAGAVRGRAPRRTSCAAGVGRGGGDKGGAFET